MVAFSRTRRRTAVALGAAAVLAVGLTSVQTPGASATALARHTGPDASADLLPYQDPSHSDPPARRRPARPDDPRRRRSAR